MTSEGPLRFRPRKNLAGSARTGRDRQKPGGDDRCNESRVADFRPDDEPVDVNATPELAHPDLDTRRWISHSAIRPKRAHCLEFFSRSVVLNLRKLQGTSPPSTGSRGTLVGMHGGLCCLLGPLPAGGLVVERHLKERVSKPRTTCRMPPHQPAGIGKQAVSCEGVLNVGPTSRTPVVFHGSAGKCLRGQG